MYNSCLFSLYDLDAKKDSCNVAEEGSSWDMVSENDLWDGEDMDLKQEDYVLVAQEDIVEGIACFMAAYLLSLKQTKVCYVLCSLLSFSVLSIGSNCSH